MHQTVLCFQSMDKTVLHLRAQQSQPPVPDTKEEAGQAWPELVTDPRRKPRLLSTFGFEDV